MSVETRRRRRQSSVSERSTASTTDFLLSSPQTIRKFDQRFHTRLESPSFSLRSVSPAPSVARSGISSISINFDDVLERLPSDAKLPWEVVRWTKLRKLSSQVYSEQAKQQFGTPTCIAVGVNIAVGTAKGMVLLFDYSQNLLCAIGANINLLEAGAVTAVGLSADNTYLASGHEHGHIYVWHIKRPMAPRMHIPPFNPLKPDHHRRDGHTGDAKILHIGFMAKRHSVLASADDKGMAFFHSSTQQLTSKTVRTTRLVGRYASLGPSRTDGPQPRQRKATSVLAFGIMPLSGHSHPVESRGLIALMTPHILVIISTAPTAQTQYKVGRPKSISDTMGLSACLDWFPAVKSKLTSEKRKTNNMNNKSHSNTNNNIDLNPRLAYCWSNQVVIFEVSVAQSDVKENKNMVPNTEFTPLKTFIADEAIVALKWLNSQIIIMVTITQRLLILNEHTMKVTESVDLVPRQIMRHDYFSEQLNDLVISGSEGSDHYVTITDGFFNSVKTFKGRLFVLGMYEFAIGHLSSWAERLSLLMESENFVDAIILATKYYSGETDQVTINLPEDDDDRHDEMRDKIIEMVLTAVRYTLSDSGRSTPTTLNGFEQDDDDAHYRKIADLAEVSFEALYVLQDYSILFGNLYELFEDANLRGVYFETLEPYILNENITSIPPAVVKELINIYASLALNERLEEMICHLDTTSLDIDQVTTLCRNFQLYDALIYVWNQSLGDYIAPMTDFVSLIRRYHKKGDDSKNNEDDQGIVKLQSDISKVYAYLSYIFTSRVYPTGQYLRDDQADGAKASLYYFLFLGSIITWPRENGKEIRTTDEKEPSFPYLRLLLGYNAPAFVAVMNEAFEDTFLNGPQDGDFDSINESDDVIFGRSINRQYIVNILLEILSGSGFTSRETIYLDMFIARNSAKYKQFITLDSLLIHQVLTRLCKPPVSEIADDCQLSVEYLLSTYRPDNLDELVKVFVEVRYFRVLKWLFKTEKNYARLIDVYFEDVTDDGSYSARKPVFDTIEECLDPHSDLSDEQRSDVRSASLRNFRNLALTDAEHTAELMEKFIPEAHASIYDRLIDKKRLQFVYLKTLFAAELSNEPASKKHKSRWNTQQARETYLCLLCEFEPSGVIKFLRHLQKGDFRISKVLAALESAGIIDGEIFLLRSEGQYAEAIRRLIRHLHYLKEQLLLLYPESARGRRQTRGTRWVHVDERKLVDVDRSLQHYVILGIRLCTEKVKKSINDVHRPATGVEALSESEAVWLDLIDSIVALTREVSSTLFPDITVFEKMSRSSSYDSPTKSILFLRRLVQDVFSSLLAATTTNNNSGASAGSHNASFLRILEAFLSHTAAASPSVVDLRNVLENIFEAYIYEKQLLSLTNQLLNRDLMVRVSKVYNIRQQGWRVPNTVCEVCGKKVWGAGVPPGTYSAWNNKREDLERRKKERFKLPGRTIVESDEDFAAQEDRRDRWRRRGRDGDVHEDENNKDGPNGDHVVGLSSCSTSDKGKNREEHAEELDDSDSISEFKNLEHDLVFIRAADDMDLQVTHQQSAGSSGGEELDSLVIQSKHVYHKNCWEKIKDVRLAS
ncbi:Golgi CORVET complex core vacuolar protein 8-domain-containing protein [Lipomyces japonicus]|uniref:Golgi CORVET complex core vacuolar protein 8-domain-containing protein n=1 Tax=Lipomyces japonicus TaxID=56871 RepID=UPI0034CE1337